MEIGIAAIIALWALSRSGMSARYVYPVEINNPADRLTAGYVDSSGRPVQPTYGKMRVGFTAPEAKFCASTGATKDGMRKYQVYYVAATEPRVVIKIPAGYKGAGTEYNISNWITQNMGEGYYVMIKGLKAGRGGYANYAANNPPDIARALSQRAIGISYVVYESAQRFIRHPYTEAGKQAAIQQMNDQFENYNRQFEPTDPMPPPTQPEPEPSPPLAPPLAPPMLPPSGGLPAGGYDLVGGGQVNLRQAEQEQDPIIQDPIIQDPIVNEEMLNEEKIALQKEMEMQKQLEMEKQLAMENEALGIDPQKPLNGGYEKGLMG